MKMISRELGERSTEKYQKEHPEAYNPDTNYRWTDINRWGDN